MSWKVAAEMPEISDEDLIVIVDRVDRDVALSGDGPGQRAFRVAVNVCNELGVQFVMGAAGGHPHFSERVFNLHAALFR